jgi:hypothetical protein
MRTVALVVAAIVFGSAACGSDAAAPSAPATPPVRSANTDAADAICAPHVNTYGPDAELVAAFASGGVYRAICWIDGHVAKSPPLREDGTVSPSFDRAVIGVRADGSPSLIKAGMRDSMPVEEP